MRVKQIGHYNLIGSAKVIEDVKKFYIEILGFTKGYRPEFGIEGDWLYIGDAPLIHLTVVEESTGAEIVPSTGRFHHVALDCEGLKECRKLLDAKKIAYQVALVPELDMTQLFLHDPAGICIELNFIETENNTTDW